MASKAKLKQVIRERTKYSLNFGFEIFSAIQKLKSQIGTVKKSASKLDV